MAEKVVYIRKAGEMYVIKYDSNEEQKAFDTLLDLSKDSDGVLNENEIMRIINILGLTPTEQ